MRGSDRLWGVLCLATMTATVLTTGCFQEDPFAVDPPVDCEFESQQDWVDGVFQEFYLWNDDLELQPHAEYETIEDYVKSLRYDEFDRFSRVALKTTSDALYMEGMFISFGFRTKTEDDGRIRFRDVIEGSPAWDAGMRRGDTLVAINEIPIQTVDDDNLWDEVYGETVPGVQADFEVEDVTGTTKTATITKDWVKLTTVPVSEVFDTPSGRVGYIHFNRFVEPSEQELDEAFAEFKVMDVQHLILDIRYNGGGLIAVARHLINLVAGASADGQLAYRVEYNADLSEQNDDRSIEKLTHSLDPDRVIVLTTHTTRSAAELSLIALQPWVDMTIVGDDHTGGKPVGMLAYDFCDYVLFPVMFRFVNAAGYTDYFEGIEPDCLVVDDMDHELGDPEEGMLAAALGLLETGDCPDEPDLPPSPRVTDLQPDPWPGEAFLR